MKLFLLSKTAEACDVACSLIHSVERGVKAVHLWAWKRASQENLRKINERLVKRYSVYR